MKSETTVLEVGGLHWATSEPIVEKTLARRPGVLAVEANASSQTATVTYDPDKTSVAQLAGWVTDCGYHCAGQSVPDHVCDPMSEPTTTHTPADPTSRPAATPTPVRRLTGTRRTPGTAVLRMRTAPRRR